MSAKKSIVMTNARLYRKGQRRTGTTMSNEPLQVLLYHRKHPAVLLKNTGEITYTDRGQKLIGDPTVTIHH